MWHVKCMLHYWYIILLQCCKPVTLLVGRHPSPAYEKLASPVPKVSCCGAPGLIYSNLQIKGIKVKQKRKEEKERNNWQDVSSTYLHVAVSRVEFSIDEQYPLHHLPVSFLTVVKDYEVIVAGRHLTLHTLTSTRTHTHTPCVSSCKNSTVECARLVGCLGFNGTFSTNRLYRAIIVG